MCKQSERPDQDIVIGKIWLQWSKEEKGWAIHGGKYEKSEYKATLIAGELNKAISKPARAGRGV